MKPAKDARFYSVSIRALLTPTNTPLRDRAFAHLAIASPSGASARPRNLFFRPARDAAVAHLVA